MLCVEPRCPDDASLGSHLSIADSSGPETGPPSWIRLVRVTVVTDAKVERARHCGDLAVIDALHLAVATNRHGEAERVERNRG